MKKLATTFLLSAGILCMSAPAFGIDVYVNNDKMNFDVQPTVINGNTLVPMRAIFEKLGATVDYDAKMQTITSKKGDITVSLNLNSPVAKKNDEMIGLPILPRVIDGNTLVPLRFISESLDYNVDYDAMLEDIFIYDTEEGNTLHKQLHKDYLIVGSTFDDMTYAMNGKKSLMTKDYYQNFINGISGNKTMGNIQKAIEDDYHNYINEKDSSLSYLWDMMVKGYEEDGLSGLETSAKNGYQKMEQNKDKTTFPK